MAYRSLASGGDQLIAQLQPPPQTSWRLRRWPRPAAASKRTFQAGKVRILPDMEKDHARAFRKGQFEVAAFGKTDEHFADQ